MSVSVPNALSLGSIPDGSLMVASDVRNDFTATQVGVNGLIAMFTTAATKGDLLVSAGGGAFDRLGVGSNGQTIEADSTQALGMKAAYPPAYEFSYDAFTSNVTGITGSSIAAATTVKTSTSVTLDGSTAVWVEFFAPEVQIGTADFRIKFELFEDSTDIGEFGVLLPRISGTPMPGGRFPMRRTPAAGAHTYTVKAFVPDGGTGIVIAGSGGSAAAVAPGYIRVIKA